jgi:hypothetical protein
LMLPQPYSHRLVKRRRPRALRPLPPPPSPRRTTHVSSRAPQSWHMWRSSLPPHGELGQVGVKQEAHVRQLAQVDPGTTTVRHVCAC